MAKKQTYLEKTIEELRAKAEKEGRLKQKPVEDEGESFEDLVKSFSEPEKKKSTDSGKVSGTGSGKSDGSKEETEVRTKTVVVPDAPDPHKSIREMEMRAKYPELYPKKAEVPVEPEIKKAPKKLTLSQKDIDFINQPVNDGRGALASESTGLDYETSVKAGSKEEQKAYQKEIDRIDYKALKKQNELNKLDTGQSRAHSALGQFNKSIFDSTVGAGLDLFSVVANQTTGRLIEAFGGERVPVEQSLSHKWAEDFRGLTDNIFYTNPAYKEELQEQFASAAGQLIPMLATGGATAEAKTTATAIGELSAYDRALNLANKAGTGIKEIYTAPPALLGAMQVGANEFRTAKAAGASDDEAALSMFKNMIVAAPLENAPIAGLFKRLNDVSKKGFARVIINGKTQGLEEMATEIMQEGFADLNAQQSYDKTRKILENAGDIGIVSFGMGAILGASGTVLKEKLSRATDPEEIKYLEDSIALVEEKKQELATKQEQKDTELAKITNAAQQQPAGQESVPVKEQQAGPVQVEPGSDIVSQQQAPVSEGPGGEINQGGASGQQQPVDPGVVVQSLQDGSLPQLIQEGQISATEAAQAIDSAGVPVPEELIQMVQQEQAQIQQQVPVEEQQAEQPIGMQPSLTPQTEAVQTSQPSQEREAVTPIDDKQLEKENTKVYKARRSAVLKNERRTPTAMARGWILEGNKLRGEQSIENKQNNPAIGKGVMEETGMGRREMGKLIGIIDNKNGSSIEEAAHAVWEGLDDNLREQYNTQDIRNAFIDVIASESREDWLSNQERETNENKTDEHEQWFYNQMPEEDRANYDDYVQSEAYYNELEENIDKLAQEYDEYLKSEEYGIEQTREGRENATDQEIEGATGQKQSEKGNRPTERKTADVIRQNGDKAKEEARLKELSEIRMTHISGLGMGQNQLKGTYLSTEEGNRYAGRGGKESEAKADISKPFIANTNSFFDIQSQAIKEHFGKDSIEDLSDQEIEDLAQILTNEFKEQGYDSVDFPASETQEGELIVFDRENVKLSEPNATKEGKITDSNQPEHIGAGKVRKTTEPGGSDSPGQGGKIPTQKGKGEGESKKKGVKSVYRNVIEKSTLSDALKTRLKADPNYNVLTNKESAELAEAFIKEFDSAEEAANSILAINTDVPMQGAVKCKVIAAGITELTNKFNQATDPASQEDLTDRQSFLIDAIDNLVRDAGQTIESIKSLYKSTELGIKKAAQRKIKKYNDKMSEKLGLSNVTEESFAETFEAAAEATANDQAIAKLQKEILELKKDLEKARAERKAKQKAETEAKKKVITDRLEKNKSKFKKIDWLSKGDMAMSTIIPIPLNPEKIKALATLAKDYIELGAVNASEVYTKLNEYIKEVTDGKGFLNEKDFAGIYDEAEKNANKSLGKDINKEIREKDIKLAELAREYYTDQENIGKSIKEELINKYGLTGQQAQVIGAKIDAIFKEKLFKEQQEQLSKQYSSKIPIISNVKKKNETMAKKLLKEINLGTLNFDIYEQLFAERHNLISYNKQSKATIDGIVKRINSSPTGTLRNRAEVELLDYIVSLQKKSLYKLGVSYMYTSMLSSYQTHLNNSVFGGLALTKQIVKRLAIPTQKNRTAVLIAMKAMNQAVLEARDILRTGYREQGTGYVQASDAMIKGNKFLKALSMAFRGLAAEDAFFNTPLTNMLEFEELVNMRMRDEKYKETKDKNYKPISVNEIVAEVNKQFEWSVENNKIQEQAAKDVVINKGLTEPLFKTRLADYTDNNGNPQTKEVLVRNPHYADKKYNDLYRLQKLRSFEILEQERDLNVGYQKQRERWAINQVNQEREAYAQKEGKEYKPAEKVEDLTAKERQTYSEILGDITGSRDEAKIWANDQLLMGTPKGDLGILARYINTTIGPDYPILKMVEIPFVNVPFNMTNYLIETSPIGSVTLVGKYLHHVITGKPMNESTFEHILGEGTASARLGLDNRMTEKRKRQLISRQAMFYGGITVAWMLTQLEYEEEDENGKKFKRPLLLITANGKGDWFKNESLKREGKYKEWTADFMGFQFSYKYSPFGGILAPLGMLSDYEKYGKKSTEAEVSLGKKVALVGMSYGSFIYESASLKGLSDLFAIGGGDSGKQDMSDTAVDKAMKGTGKWMAKQAQKLVPASGFLKALNEDIAGIIGADDKVASQWYEYFMRDIPGLDIMLTTKKDHLGRPVPSVTDVPLLYNGNFEQDDYYSICNKFGYENRYYWKYEIADPRNTRKAKILTQQELTELNNIRGKFAFDRLMKGNKGQRGIDNFAKLAKSQPTELLQKEMFDKQMDQVFTEATKMAKVEWFKKNQ